MGRARAQKHLLTTEIIKKELEVYREKKNLIPFSSSHLYDYERMHLFYRG